LTWAGQTVAEETVQPGISALERGHYSTAMRSWLPLARNGLAEAQNNVALMYERGLGVNQNYAEAMAWYRKAADQGLAEANLNLGLLYYSGYGTQVNDREAYKRFKAAADDQLAEGQYMLGLLQYSGRGTAQSALEAAANFRRAAVQGYVEAQYMLAYILLSGDLGQMFPEAAYIWSKIAKDQGFADADEMNYLSTLSSMPHRFRWQRWRLPRVRNPTIKIVRNDPKPLKKFPEHPIYLLQQDVNRRGFFMALRNKALESYGDVSVRAGTAYADSVQLIQMLFDGLIDSLAAAEGQLERNEIQDKGDSLSRAIRIVLGLQGSLDYERGGEIATNLGDLYDYCTRRLLHANLRNDIEAVREVNRLMSEIRDAWTQVPELLAQRPMAQVS